MSQAESQGACTAAGRTSNQGRQVVGTSCFSPLTEPVVHLKYVHVPRWMCCAVPYRGVLCCTVQCSAVLCSADRCHTKELRTSASSHVTQSPNAKQFHDLPHTDIFGFEALTAIKLKATRFGSHKQSCVCANITCLKLVGIPSMRLVSATSSTKKSVDFLCR